MENLINKDDYKVPGDWNLLWQLKVPPKVKHFMLRLLRNSLPTRWRLQSRGVHCCILCEYCQSNLENSWHVFFGCQQVQRFWLASDLARHQQRYNLDWYSVQIAAKSLHRIGIKFAMLLWCIWRRRNDKIWNHIDLREHVSINLTMQSYTEWCHARKGKSDTWQKE